MSYWCSTSSSSALVGLGNVLHGATLAEAFVLICGVSIVDAVGRFMAELHIIGGLFPLNLPPTKGELVQDPPTRGVS
jgi:hypothetical protein